MTQESVQESNQESNQESSQESSQEKLAKPLTGRELEKMGLTQKQITIVMYCTMPRSADEILTKVGVSACSKNRAVYVYRLVEKGILRMTIPSNPKDRNQKYIRNI